MPPSHPDGLKSWSRSTSHEWFHVSPKRWMGMSLCGLTPGKEIAPLKLLVMAEIMQHIIIGFSSPTETPSTATARKFSYLTVDRRITLTFNRLGWSACHFWGGSEFLTKRQIHNRKKHSPFSWACKLGPKTTQNRMVFFSQDSKIIYTSLICTG